MKLIRKYKTNIRRVVLIAAAFILLTSQAANALSDITYRAQNDIIYYGGDSCAPGGGENNENPSVTGSENGWTYPTERSIPITSDYKAPNRPGHRGVDLAVANTNGKPIFASRDGTVVKAGPADGFGIWIVIQHEVDGKRVDSVYGHMFENTVKVKVGDKVKAGQRIADIGYNGSVSPPGEAGAHLHYEEWDGGRDGGTERKPEAVYGKSGSADTTAVSEVKPSSTDSNTQCCANGSSGGDGGGCGEKGNFTGAACQGGKTHSEANKQQIIGFFKGKGFGDTAIAGILGNMDQESCGFMPDAHNGNIGADSGDGVSDPGKGKGCRGIVQWCKARNEKLTKFAESKGSTWDCLGTQLEYVWHEITETAEKGVVDKIKAAKTPSEAANIWARDYERPGAGEYAGRAEKAEFHAKSMNGGGGATTANTSASTCSSSTKGADGFVYYSQNDQQWQKDGLDIANSGCGPTSIAMIIATKKDKTVTPVIVTKFLQEKGLWSASGGIQWDGFKAAGDKWGMKVTDLGSDWTKIKDALKAGKLLTMSGTGGSPFTSGGHIVVARGITDDGKIIIANPADKMSPTPESTPYTVEQLTAAGFAKAWSFE